MLVLAARIARALSSTPGAITASMNVATMARAVSSSIPAVEADDAAECREGVGFARPHVGLGNDGAGGGAAGLVCLITAAAGSLELQHDARGGVEVEQIRERQLFALQHRAAHRARGR